ncbi:MAG: FeoB-associated Cys-rich membrane protein [Oscillospiraceae bacterium]|nr:FeoB-associated Cys-rich membrane protein [Oscillospiraceae bacterium]
MQILDVIIVAAAAELVVLAIRSAIKSSGAGRCGGCSRRCESRSCDCERKEP